MEDVMDIGRRLVFLFHKAFVAHLDKDDADDNPKYFSYASVEAGEESDGGCAEAEDTNDGGEGSLASTELHREEEEEVANEGGEGEDDDGVCEAHRDAQGAKDEEILEGIEDAAYELKDERAIKGTRL